jgi:hypothetical protein
MQAAAQRAACRAAGAPPCASSASAARVGACRALRACGRGAAAALAPRRRVPAPLACCQPCVAATPLARAPFRRARSALTPRLTHTTRVPHTPCRAAGRALSAHAARSSPAHPPPARLLCSSPPAWRCLTRTRWPRAARTRTSSASRAAAERSAWRTASPGAPPPATHTRMRMRISLIPLIPLFRFRILSLFLRSLSLQVAGVRHRREPLLAQAAAQRGGRSAAGGGGCG